MNLDAFHNLKIKSVIAGISGGADSVAMLRAYLDEGIKVYAVHCNFHLRGDESERDQHFVENLCKKLNVPLRIKDFDVKKYQNTHKVSIEMACRELRYEAFRDLKRELNADRIAVAHNADDNVETMLLNLMRGAGISGLRGMLPDTGEIVRPLLEVWRKDILSYLDAIGQNYVTDHTNLECDFRRNFIRNKVIPLLNEEWPEAKRSIMRSMHNLLEEESVLTAIEHDHADSSKNFLKYSVINNFDRPEWLIYRFVRRYGGSRTHAEEIFKTITSENFVSGKKWYVNNGIISAERECLEYIADGEQKIVVTSFKYEDPKKLLPEITQAPLTELWTNLEENDLVFRHPLPGDKIKPLGMKGSVPVSKIMKDAKLSASEKKKQILAVSAETGEIIWVRGLKRSRNFLVAPHYITVYKYIADIQEYGIS